MSSLTNVGALMRFLIRQNRHQDLEKLTQQIDEMSQQTGLLLNNLLEWGKSQYFKKDGHVSNDLKKNTDVVPILQQLQQYYQPFADAKDVKLNLSLPPSLIVNTDPDGLGLALRNLLDNALKYTPQGGQIHITVINPTHRDGSPLRGKGGATVSNTATIPPDQLHHLQEIFANRTQPEIGRNGIGLGTAIIHDFALRTKATIEVESNQEKGTTFRVWLPVSQ
jgi:signal transduction histidine kinase